MAVYATNDLNVPGYDKPVTNFWGRVNIYQYRLAIREELETGEERLEFFPYIWKQEDLGPYGEECPNHHLQCNIMEDDQKQFVEEAAATKKWRATMKKFFPKLKKWELPEMEFLDGVHESQAAVLSSEDLMTKFIIPKLGYEDGMNIMGTCRRWGKILAQNFLKPDENLVYRNSLFYYQRTYWSGWYRGRIENGGKRVIYFCTCQTWDEYAKEGENAYWLSACSDDEFEDEGADGKERNDVFQFKKYSNKFKPRPKLTLVKRKEEPRTTYIAPANESYVYTWSHNFMHHEGMAAIWPSEIRVGNTSLRF